MKLVVAMVEGDAAPKVLLGLQERGYAALQVDEGNGTVSLLVPVQTELLPQLLALLGSWCRFEAEDLNPLLPLSDPGEYYVANPVPAGKGGSALFVLGLQRYERIN